MQPVIINKTFNGPPDSGNGGYCCGRFAQLMEGSNTAAIEVTLKNPIPLGVPLSARPIQQGIIIQHQEQRIAEVKAGTLDIDILPAPDISAAKQAESNYEGHRQHPFPDCFVCGPKRCEGDGLRVFAGALEATAGAADPGPPRVAAVWQPYPELADNDGHIGNEFLWAVLDCPSYFGAFTGQQHRTALLGRQTVSLLTSAVPVDQPYLVQAWPLAAEGRKHHAAAAIYRSNGDCIAIANTVWITL